MHFNTPENVGSSAGTLVLQVRTEGCNLQNTLIVFLFNILLLLLYIDR